MGEAPKLDAGGFARGRHDVREARPGLPVIVGVSAPGFAAMRCLARASWTLGAAGVMIAPPPSLRTDDQIVAYFRQASEAIGDGRSFRDPGLSADALGGHDAGGHPPHRHGQPCLRDAQARGLAGPGEDLARCAAFRRTASCGRSRSSPAMAASSSTSRWSAAPTAR